MIIRPMTPADLSYAASLTQAEGWLSETIEEFDGFHARDPQGCLVAERDGRRVAIGVATGYGDTGFLGQIVVAPEARGQGLGAAMVAALLERLRAAGVRGVWLDATTAGAPLYERLGFRKVQSSLRYAGTLAGGDEGAMHGVRPMTQADIDRVCALDRLWWGADRGWFLRRRLALHPDLCHVLDPKLDGPDGIAGYVLVRRRAGRVWVGPWCAAPHVERPEVLLHALARAGDGAPVPMPVPIHAGVLASSARARAALERLGFAPGFEHPWRMVWGEDAGLARGAEVLANGTSAKG
jgi:ribosomal protein S18 acetylase RimI-like enzyme